MSSHLISCISLSHSLSLLFSFAYGFSTHTETISIKCFNKNPYMKSFYVEYMCLIIMRLVRKQNIIYCDGSLKTLNHFALVSVSFCLHSPHSGWLGKSDNVSNAKKDDDASGKIQILVTVSFLHPVVILVVTLFFSHSSLCSFIVDILRAKVVRLNHAQFLLFHVHACDVIYIFILQASFVSYARRLLIFHEYFPINCYVAKQFLLTHFLSINYMFAYYRIHIYVYIYRCSR